MNFKERFRKALFAFFKEEILKEAAPQGPFEIQTIHHSQLKFHELRMEWRIAEEREFKHIGRPIEFIYEGALNDARKRLFEQVMQYVQVDERTVLDPQLYDGRIFRATVFVAENPKKSL